MGYFDKKRTEESWFRNIGFISYRTQGGKEGNINKFWFIPSDKEEPTQKTLGDTPEEIRQTIEMIKKAHKIK